MLTENRKVQDGAERPLGSREPRRSAPRVHLVLVLLIVAAMLIAYRGGSAAEVSASSAAPAEAQLAATGVALRVDPASTTKYVGDEWTARVYLDAGTNPVQAADVELTFDPTRLQILSVMSGTTLQPLAGWPKVVGGNKVAFVGLKTGDPATGSFVLFSIQFRALTVTPSTALQLVKTDVARGDGYKYPNVQASNGTVTINAPAATATATRTATATNTPTATRTPTRTNTPTITPTPDCTKAPTPTRTNTPASGILERVLRQEEGVYAGFRDTFIDMWLPTTNNDLEHRLKIGAPAQQSALIRVDLSEFAPGTLIEQAVLTLYEAECPPNSMEALVYQVLREWVVNQATWQKATAQTNWATAGCSAPGVDRAASLALRVQVFPACCDGQIYPFDLDITSMVQSWVNDPASNYGLLIVGGGSVATQYKFFSSDSRNPIYRP
ncbi:MAG: DNRLRE domain-containing protein, partial [Chloroflexi bacterium]|nr:DNRLRE domain-containing protein [Chloroflexota bacterium]